MNKDPKVRRWSVEAWWEIDGRCYTADRDGDRVAFRSSDRNAVVRFWEQIAKDPGSAGVPTDADAAWVSDVVTEQQTSDGRWFVLDHIDKPAHEGCLWDNREVPETDVDWRGMAEAHIASLHAERAA